MKSQPLQMQLNSGRAKRKLTTCNPMDLSSCAFAGGNAGYNRKVNVANEHPVSVSSSTTIVPNQYDVTQTVLNSDVIKLDELFRDNCELVYWKDKSGQSILHLAAANNRVEVIEWAVRNGIDVNGQDKGGNTALHEAVKHEAMEAIEALLTRKANCSLSDRRKQNPLHLATELNKPQVLKMLSQYMIPADLLNGGDLGRTALHQAAINDFTECATILLSYELKSNLRKTCDNGFTPIHEASRNSSSATLAIMLQWGERMGLKREEMMRFIDPEGNQPIHFAVHSGDIKTVRECLMSGALISAQQKDMSTPLHLACSLGELDIVKLMFSTQPEEKLKCINSGDAQQMTPLHYAAMFDHETIVNYLLEEGAFVDPVDLEGRTPLLLAATRGKWPILRLLLSKGACARMKDVSQRNIVHHMVMNGGNLKEFIQQLPEVELRTLMNEKDISGCTPLHYASRQGQIRSTESLIELGAKVNLKNKDNSSPLHFAARFGRYNTMLELLQSERGPLIINEADGEGLTSLHIASHNGHTKLVRLLLTKGALLQRACPSKAMSSSRVKAHESKTLPQGDHCGRTPLHLAALNGFTHTMELLLSVHSHLLDQVDKDGNTPLHLATQENHANAVTLLLSSNCKLLANTNNRSAMDLALLYKHSESAMAMATHKERAYEILRMNTEASEGVIQSLIAVMPEVFQAVLDQCIERSSIKNNEQSYSVQNTCKSTREPVKYSFKYLQYTRQFEKEMGEKNCTHLKHSPLPAMNVMTTMVQYRRLDLLTHPVCQKYIQMKWNAYGKYFHMANLLVYILFVAILTFFAMGLMKAIQAIDDDVAKGFRQDINLQDQIVESSLNSHIMATVIVVFATVNIFKEIMQFYQQKLKYVQDVINFLEWTLYVSSLVMVMPRFTGVVNDYNLTGAATSVFIAWFNLLLYLQRFDRVGIYVVMFLEILQTLIKALLIFSILVVAFGLSFFVLLSRGHHLGFSSIPMSLIRVFNMMLGEFDVMGTFIQPYYNASSNATTLPHPNFSLTFLIVFMVLMPILLVNLLIGLAVGDIDSVRRNAYLKRLAMQVDLHTELEKKIPKVILSRIDKEEIIEYPNSVVYDGCPQFWKLVRKMFGSVYTSDDGMRPGDTGSTLEENALNKQMQKQNDRIKKMSWTIKQMYHMIRLVVQKMEIRTEANDVDEGDSFHDKKYSKWSSPTLAVKLRTVSALNRARKRLQDININ